MSEAQRTLETTDPTTPRWDRAAQDGDDLQHRLATFLTLQAGACRDLGSAVYADLCDAVSTDVRAGGVCWDLLASRAHLPFGSALILRFFGAVHRLALRGSAPELAAQYPSCGGTPGSGLWDAFEATVRSHAVELERELDATVQTNEVGRSAALYEALGRVAARTGLPLALHEIGASAGLNLAMPWFRYVDGDRIGGDPAGRVEIADRWRGDVRPALRAIDVAARAGCDLSPLDVAHDETTLLGFLWPDQIERRARTRAAIETLREHPVTIEQAHADQWLEGRLAGCADGRVTVVYHSIMWQYVEAAERARITAVIEAAGGRATPTAPVAWVRFEPADDHLCAITTWRLWNGADASGETVEAARSGFHGEWVELAPE